MNKLELINELIKINFNTKDYIVVCIGTQKSYLDSVGPFVGSLLKKKNSDIIVIGELGDNCHALSLEKKIKLIKKYYSDKKILAIDACCTNNIDKLGTVELVKGSIRPGAGVGKTLPAIGDYSIKAFMTLKEQNFLLDDSMLKIYADKNRYIKYVDDSVKLISSAIITANKNYWRCCQ